MNSSENENNRLKHEKSPYLMQHANNPVNWYPWGKEAFDRAKKENKPIFLSIGYATCHWCHVMEKESFADEEVAGILNKVFINIKVDREELPAVDSLYMEFAQALMSGHGGWPLNLVLTPDLKPFFASTYLPPHSKKGIIGIREFAQQISMLWNSDNKNLLIEQADKIVEMLEGISFESDTNIHDKQLINKSILTIFENFDTVYGGLKGHHKFPMPYLISLLIAYGYKYDDSRSLFLASLTLDRMLIGGIHDHVGGGFSRYTVDEKWQIPHFEKMLSDNASIASALLEAYRYLKESAYLKACCKTLDYTICELQDTEGGFCSAQDADSKGEEGYYYTWDYDELKAILPPDIFALFSTYYLISQEGNYEEKNILYSESSVKEFADVFKLSVEHVALSLNKAHRLLLEERKNRSLFLDDKIITSSNGLIIDALALAALFLDQKRYLDQAIQAANFIKNHLYVNGRLIRRYRDKEAKFLATLDDYAFLIKGLLSLFEATGEAFWLEWSIELAAIIEKEFKCESGAYYVSSEDDSIIIRRVELVDGSEPSSNAVHAENLLRLYQITKNSQFLQAAESIIKAASLIIDKYPSGACYHLKVLQRYLDKKALTMIVALDNEGSCEDVIRESLKNLYVPHMVVIWKKKGGEALNLLAPSLQDKIAIDGQTTLYICYEDGCLPPVLDKEQMLQTLQAL